MRFLLQKSMIVKGPLKIGTRKSALALKQTELVRQAIIKHYPHLAEDGAIEIIEIKTLGDTTQKQNLSLADHGGKALWASEHEQAMREGKIDFAVHSVKDIPGVLDDDMDMPYMLPRADARDVFLSPTARHFMDLPKGAVVGTSSPRRAAMVLAKRPDIKIETFRGNIGTRLAKIARHEVDGTFLAAAGMIRGGYEDIIQTILSPDEMLPAVGQGAIGLEFKRDREDLYEFLLPIHCTVTGVCVKMERAWLAGMGGSCRSPLAALAEFKTDHVRLRAFAADLKGRDIHTNDIKCEGHDHGQLISAAQKLAAEMRDNLPAGFI